jgi:hypothetical protein
VRTGHGLFACAVCAMLIAATAVGTTAAHAQGVGESAHESAKAAAKGNAGFDVLRGRWVRPDGRYVITIRSADAEGKLDASYANPNPLPFAAAQASREGGIFKLFFELRAGGYGGSTYTLTYNAAKDIGRSPRANSKCWRASPPATVTSGSPAPST